ncbi:molybdenum cofactor biosynthesis enzyme MoaA [Streptomyces sp. V2I9]|nr:molybdenum cofactor biosynthesis enzyme MoaA [Streptomyces sp. V2I9]
MIEEVTGIKKIRMLYLQLLYRCNFTCLHCFHGKRLQYADAFTVDEAADLLTLMRDEYGTEAVTLLGGEPFVHRDLAQVVRHAKEELGLRVEICTNGYRIERRLTEIAPPWTCSGFLWRASGRPTTASESRAATRAP